MKSIRWKWPAAWSFQQDGHFRYAFTYGAVDEEAEGDWSFDGKKVHLTSRPMPKEPSFDLVSDHARAPNARSTLVEWSWGKFGWSSAARRRSSPYARHPECAATSCRPTGEGWCIWTGKL